MPSPRPSPARRERVASPALGATITRNRSRGCPDGQGMEPLRTRTHRARRLRRDETHTEKQLWSLLRGRKVAGLKFRRQQPLGRFVVDFFCSEAALVVEADGPIHAERVEYDAEREAWLTAAGLTVLRFSNHDILEHPRRALVRILCTVSSDSSHRTRVTPLSPKRERAGVRERFFGRGGRGALTPARARPPRRRTRCRPRRARPGA
jgi:very-short-patch-repair endonuclease